MEKKILGILAWEHPWGHLPSNLNSFFVTRWMQMAPFQCGNAVTPSGQPYG